MECSSSACPAVMPAPWEKTTGVLVFNNPKECTRDGEVSTVAPVSHWPLDLSRGMISRGIMEGLLGQTPPSQWIVKTAGFASLQCSVRQIDNTSSM